MPEHAASPAQQRVAVVTGSNKGIGFEIVKGLCKKFNGVVYLTSRDVTKGEAAVAKLKEAGLNPLYHQLDITDSASIEKLRDDLNKEHGGIDLLVNNAAIAYAVNTNEPLKEQAENTINVNYYGTVKVCDRLFPILKQDARVVNISSSAGHLSRVKSDELKAKIGNKVLTINGLNNLVEKFLSDVRENKRDQEGWPNTMYSASKVFISALTFIQQRNFDNEQPPRNISVNAVHPGWVKTDMTNNTGYLEPEEGARAPLFVALEADFKGKYVWYNSQPYDWYAENIPTHSPTV